MSMKNKEVKWIMAKNLAKQAISPLSLRKYMRLVVFGQERPRSNFDPLRREDWGSCALNLSIFECGYPRLSYDKDTAKSPASSNRKKVRAVMEDAGRNDRPWRGDGPDSPRLISLWSPLGTVPYHAI